MGYRIIAISREFGSGGRTIGREVANRLGIPCYDQEIIEMLAEKSGFSEKHIAQLDEQTTRSKPFSGRGGRVDSSSILQSSLWEKQKRLIQELAEKEPCVIVGRCADYVLQDREDCLRVFIRADIAKRMERICNVYGETAESPRKRIEDKDKRRKAFYQRYTDQRWADAANFHICLDSGTMGIETCVEILEHLYRGK